MGMAHATARTLGVLAGLARADTRLLGLCDVGEVEVFRRAQPAWRDAEPEAQMWRFLRSGARCNLRYARLHVQVATAGGTLAPLLGALLEAVRDGSG